MATMFSKWNIRNILFHFSFLFHFYISFNINENLSSIHKNVNCSKSCPLCSKELIYCSQYDQCGCCQSCLRLYGEFCDENNLCDHRKQLVCQIDESAENGVCKYMEKSNYQEKICIFNGMVYNSSDGFSVSCRHRCQCIDGLVTCQDLCKAVEQSAPPPLSICPYGAELIPSGDNQCCREWSCKNDYSGLLTDQLRTFIKKRKHSNKLCVNKIQSNTPWSKCSKTCGMGISTRTSTNNVLCVNITQKRFCMYRECEDEFDSMTRKLSITNSCIQTNRPVNASNIRIVLPNDNQNNYSEIICLSKRKFRPRYCGNCNKCCEPTSSKTKRIEFLCSDKITRIQMYEWIKTCACSKNCA